MNDNNNYCIVSDHRDSLAQESLCEEEGGGGERWQRRHGCTFTENEYCCTHVSVQCECSFDHRGFIYQLLPPAIVSNIKVTLNDIDSNLFNVECRLPAREYLLPWENSMIGKPAAFQLFVKLVQFFELINQYTSYWPNVEYFSDIVLVSGVNNEGTIKFLRPTKFTNYKMYLVGLRKLFLRICRKAAANMIEAVGPEWVQNIDTGKGVNIKYCKARTFIHRPPPFVKNMQEATCRRDEDTVVCPHFKYVAHFRNCERTKKFFNILPDEWDRLHLACPRTLKMYEDEGVEFRCLLFPEARAFFSELGRSDKLHTVFCYPDELLDTHWFAEFWGTLNQYRALVDSKRYNNHQTEFI